MSKLAFLPLIFVLLGCPKPTIPAHCIEELRLIKINFHFPMSQTPNNPCGTFVTCPVEGDPEWFYPQIGPVFFDEQKMGEIVARVVDCPGTIVNYWN